MGGGGGGGALEGPVLSSLHGECSERHTHQEDEVWTRFIDISGDKQKSLLIHALAL